MFARVFSLHPVSVPGYGYKGMTLLCFSNVTVETFGQLIDFMNDGLITQETAKAVSTAARKRCVMTASFLVYRSVNYASTGLWRDYLQRIPTISSWRAGIRGAGPCKGPPACFVVALGGPIRKIWAWRAQRLPERWPDGGQSSRVDAVTRCSCICPYIRPDLTPGSYQILA